MDTLRRRRRAGGTHHLTEDERQRGQVAVCEERSRRASAEAQGSGRGVQVKRQRQSRGWWVPGGSLARRPGHGARLWFRPCHQRCHRAVPRGLAQAPRLSIGVHCQDEPPPGDRRCVPGAVLDPSPLALSRLCGRLRGHLVTPPHPSSQKAQPLFCAARSLLPRRSAEDLCVPWPRPCPLGCCALLQLHAEWEAACARTPSARLLHVDRDLQRRGHQPRGHAAPQGRATALRVVDWAGTSGR